MSNSIKTVFVFGGGYIDRRSGRRHFQLACHNKGLPYVARSEDAAVNALRLMEHHAHTYQLNIETGVVTIKGKSIKCFTDCDSFRLGVTAPEAHILSYSDLESVKDQCEKEAFIGEW